MFPDFIARQYINWDKSLYIHFKMPSIVSSFHSWLVSPPVPGGPPLWDLQPTPLLGTGPSFL